MTSQSKSYIYACLSVLAWSTVATAFKLTLSATGFLQMLFYASLTSLITYILILTANGEIIKLKYLSGREVLNSAVLGFLNPYLYYLVLFRAYSLLQAQEALVLNYTWAIVVVVLSIIVLGQKISIVNIISLLVSFFGVVIIATKGKITSINLDEPFGVALALGSSLIWGLYWVLNVRDRREAVVKLLLNFLFGTFYITITIIISGESFRVNSGESLLGCLYIGLFEMGITFIFWLKALQYSKTTARVSNLIYLSPFMSLILIAVVLKEGIFFSSIIGLILVIAGIVLQQFKINVRNN